MNRPFMRLLVPLIAVGLFAGRAAAQETFRFVHITDTHVTATTHDEFVRQLMRDISAAQGALSPRPAFVLNSGDVTELGRPEEFDRYLDAVKDAPVPVYNAPGNHDVRWAPLGKEGFTNAFKKRYQSFDYGGCHFVELDSTVLLQHWGHFDTEQLKWLEGDLKKLKKDAPVFVFFHHWLGRENPKVDNGESLLRILRPYNVLAMFIGHGHSDIQWKVNGIQCVMARGLYQGSYHVVDVTPGEVIIRRVRKENAGQIPEIVATIPRRRDTPPQIAFGWDDPNIPLLSRRRFIVELQVKKKALVSPNIKAEYSIDGGAFVAMTDDKRPNMEKVQERRREERRPPKDPKRPDDRPEDRKDDPKTPQTKPDEQKRDEKPVYDEGRYVAQFSTKGMRHGGHTLTIRFTDADGVPYQREEPFAFEEVSGQPKREWDTPTGDTIQSSPVLAGDTVYITSFDGKLHALETKTGKRRWATPTKGAIYGSPCVAGETVYVGSMDHYLYAIEAKSGKVRWKFDTGAPLFATPAVANEIVCIGGSKMIYGIGVADGKPRWTQPANGFFQSRTAVADGVFVLGGWDNTLYALDITTGQPRWKTPMGRTNGGRGTLAFYYSPAITNPAVGMGADAGRIFVCTNDGVLHAVNLKSGMDDWIARAPAGGDTFGYSSPLYANGRVYVGGLGEKNQGDCYALDAKTGTLVWRCSTGMDNYDSSPALVGEGLIAIGSVQGVLSWIDTASGKVMHQYALDAGYCFSTPTAAPGRLTFLPSMNGTVYAVSLP